MTTVADMPVLDRRVDACACPDCGMPMSIRMWLRTADCLRCGTSIALDFLPQADLAPDPAKLFAAEPQETLDVDFDITPPPVISAAERFWRSLHRLLSCLFSIIAHLLLLLLLAFITWGAGSQEDRTINLSVEFDKNERDGGVLVDEQIETVGFQLPVEPKKSKQEIEADQWAKQLAVEDGKSAPNLPPIERVEQALESDDPYRRMLSARDPRIRKQIIKQEGGTNRTEAAVARALDWMARHQARDGSWSLHEFHRAGDCRGRCRNRGHMQSDEGATAMALMAMLGAGQTHRTGIYRDEVSHGLQFLLARQDREGGLIGGSAHQAGMYSHGLATIALCDAYAMTGDSTLREPAQQALNYLMAAQHREGGWRYEPGERGDLSVTGWQLMGVAFWSGGGVGFRPRSIRTGQRVSRRGAVATRWFAIRVSIPPRPVRRHDCRRFALEVVSRLETGRTGTPARYRLPAAASPDPNKSPQHLLLVLRHAIDASLGRPRMGQLEPRDGRRVGDHASPRRPCRRQLGSGHAPMAERAVGST